MAEICKRAGIHQMPISRPMRTPKANFYLWTVMTMGHLHRHPVLLQALPVIHKFQEAIPPLSQTIKTRTKVLLQALQEFLKFQVLIPLLTPTKFRLQASPVLPKFQETHPLQLTTTKVKLVNKVVTKRKLA